MQKLVVIALHAVLVMILCGSALAACPRSPLPHGKTPDGFCAYEFASGLPGARQLQVGPSGEVLVVSSSDHRVHALWPAGPNASWTDVVIGEAPGLNHGLFLSQDGRELFASSADAVYMWAYKSEPHPLAAPRKIVHNIDPSGHVARSLLLRRDRATGRETRELLVQRGSLSNVDRNSTHALIRVFNLEHLADPAHVFDYRAGEVFADGLRNSECLGYDLEHRLYAMDNGRDQLFRADLGGDIHQWNPAEELNHVERGHHYGYPHCFSVGKLEHVAHLTQLADTSNFPHATDAECQNRTLVTPPLFGLPAHMAPLGMAFLHKAPAHAATAFPARMVGDAFVASHGSWNADPPRGYLVAHIEFGSDGRPTGKWEPMLRYDSEHAKGPGWPHRPVDVVQTVIDGVETLLVTSDASGVIIAIVPDM